MTTTVTVRNFTGRSFSLDVDPASRVSDVKGIIARTMGKQGFKPSLTWKGHELRDHQSLSHYGVSSGHVLNILPPSKVPKISLQFERRDGNHFTLQVNSDASVSQLKRDLAFEEKIDPHCLKFVVSLEDSDDPDTLFVSEPQDLLENAMISQYPLADATIFIYGLPQPTTPPTSFNVCVAFQEGEKLEVEVTLQQTLNDFREAVRLQHHVSITDHALIFVGREVVGDEIPIWDLGFVPGSVIHAVPFISFNVEIVWVKVFDTLLLHPLTRLSAVRKRLEQEALDNISLDKYWFTLDGMEHLSETRRLWDLDLISGSTLYMRSCVLSFKVRLSTNIHQVDVEEEETIWGLKERLSLITSNIDIPGRRIMYRGKLLEDNRTVKEEGLVGGEMLICVSLPESKSFDSMDNTEGVN